MKVIIFIALMVVIGFLIAAFTNTDTSDNYGV
jgi:hypothetical protein